MPSQKSTRPLRLAMIWVLLGTPWLVSADGNDDLWEITTRTEMAGMPMAMPAQTNKVCQPKGRAQEETAAPADKHCKMTNMQRSGNKSSFTIVCDGKDSFSGTGNFEHNADSYSGTMRMQGSTDGETFEMTQTVSGKRVGSCAYKDVGKEMAARTEAATVETCRRSIDKLEWPVYKDDLVAACKPLKKDFCARVAQVSGDMRSAAGFKATVEKQRDWESLLGTCGIAPQPILAGACQDAGNTKNWNFLAQYCPTEARAIAQEQCSGRDYTAVMSGPYGALCSQYGAQVQPTGTRVAQPVDAVEAAKEGVKSSLKKLLPF